MKKTALLLSFLGSLLGFRASAQMVMSWDEAYSKADELIATLTLEEKIKMTRGYSSFYFPGIPEKGINAIYLSDATQGVRINNKLADTTTVRQLPRTTAFPCPVMLAATFNPILAWNYGKDVGEECNAGNIRVLLGPGVNIYRDSQCGRNFEYMGEDPYLAGQIAANYVKGMQTTGTAACMKHFLCNNIEYQRRNCNVIVDERTLHEIYLPVFKAGVDAGLAFVMTSYNLVNGEWCGQSDYVINGLLRKELGFRGGVMTDWRSVYNYKKVILSGQNIEMPGGDDTITRGTLSQWMKQGEITEKDIENMIRPLIATCIAFNLYDRDAWDKSLQAKFPEHAARSYSVAAEGTVLLKNNGILPLKPTSISSGKLLVCGRFIDELPRGKGSGDVKGYSNVSLREAIENDYGYKAVFKENPTIEEIRSASAVLLSVGTMDRESIERPFDLPSKENEFAKKVVENNANTIVLVNSGSGINMSDWVSSAAAVIFGFYPGQSGMTAIADIIRGKVCPSGKLPFTIEKSFSDSPAACDIPSCAVLGERNKDEHTVTIYDVEYDEGVLVGYRWYEAKAIEPLYAFGHGLSYTKFSLGKPSLSSKELTDADEIVIKLQVKNIGACDGREVVQLYVGEDNPTVERPVKELKAFSKVFIPQGGKTTVELKVKAADLAFWDVESHSWKANPGTYTLYIGTASDAIAHKVTIEKK